MTGRLLALLAVTAVACSGGDRRDTTGGARDGGGGGSPTTACRAVVDAVELPYAVRHAIAPGPTGYVIVAEVGGFGSEDWSTFTLAGASSTRHDVSVGQSPIALVGNATTTAAFAPGRLVTQVAVRRWDGAAWTVDDAERSEDFGAVTDFSKGSALALGADGSIAALWSEGGFSEPLTAWLSLYDPASGFTPRTPAFTPDDGVDGPELHADFGADGALHVLARRSTGDGSRMVYRRRDAQGGWSEVVDVGSVPGALANVVATGLAVVEDGTVYVAEAHGQDTQGGVEGGVLVYRIQGTTAEVVARVDDDRIVMSGLAVAPYGDRIVVAVARGANDFDPAASDDSVEVFACDDDGCTAPLRVAPRPGVFYEAVSMTAREGEAAAVWTQSPKAGVNAPEANYVVRFTCP